jgi:hypothetical protein
MGDGLSRATFGNIGPEIQARLQAGDPPGKIAMYLEQLEPGLGRALLGQINQAAGSTKRVSIPFFPQQNYGGAPGRAFSASRPSNGMPIHQNFRSELTGDAPQAIHGAAGRSVGVNPPPLKSAGVSVPNGDKARPANGSHIDGRTGPPMLGASSPERHPGYIALAYKPGDNFWGPPPRKPGILPFIKRSFEDADRVKKAALLQTYPQIRSNFNRTIKTIVGDSFTSEEMNLISREIIDNISDDEGALFADGAQMKNGVVYLNEGQWRAVHRLVGTIPKDKLGQRVRAAVAEAAKRGRLRRKNKDR